jgi:DNA polymerase-3 subunit gamma/tau
VATKKSHNTNKSDLITLEWHEIVPKLNLTGRAAELIKHCILKHIEAHKIYLSLDKDGEDLLAKTTELQIETALSEYYNNPMQLIIDTLRLTEETPAARLARKHQESQQIAENLIEHDLFVNELQQRFKAQIVLNSIKPN